MVKKTKQSQKELAKSLKLHPVYLNAVLKGRRVPSIELAIKIERASNGKYKATDLRPDLKGIVNDVLNCRL